MQWFCGSERTGRSRSFTAPKASFLPRRPPAWSLEDSAVWRARVEFELLKLLATDRKALVTARRLGMPLAIQPSQVAGKLLSRLLLPRCRPPRAPQ